MFMILPLIILLAKNANALYCFKGSGASLTISSFCSSTFSCCNIYKTSASSYTGACSLTCFDSSSIDYYCNTDNCNTVAAISAYTPSPSSFTCYSGTAVNSLSTTTTCSRASNTCCYIKKASKSSTTYTAGCSTYCEQYSTNTYLYCSTSNCNTAAAIAAADNSLICFYGSNSASAISSFTTCSSSFSCCMIVKSAAGRYSAGCSYTCETSTASINYCTSSYCNENTLVSTASSYVTSCNYANYDTNITSTKQCSAFTECCYITANFYSYSADCSSTCSGVESTASAYCFSNNCNTISLVRGITLLTTVTTAYIPNPSSGTKCVENLWFLVLNLLILQIHSVF